MRNLIRKLIFFLTAVIIMITAGCSVPVINPIENDSGEDHPDEVATYKLLYCKNDSLDPFLSSTTYNRQLFSLIYSGLFSVSANGSPECEIASDWETDGNTITVVLSEKYFSDGTKVTAEDVLKSYNYAKNSEYYKSRFSYISSYAVKEGKFTVKFNGNAENNLSLLDIPIIKRTDSYPLGTGDYYISSSDSGIKLIRKNGKSEIILNNIENASMAVYSFNVQKTDAVAVNMSVNTVKVKGNYELKYYLTNSFVYVGFNCDNNYFKYPAVRKAFNLILDRSALSEEFHNDGEFVWHPFNPEYYSLHSFDLPDSVFMPESARDLLSDNGFATINKKIFSFNGTVNLIVNTEDSFKVSLAEKISSLLAKQGITVNVAKLDYSRYVTALKNGDYDLFIAETVMPQNMDITVLTNNNLNYGNYKGNSLKSLYTTVAETDTFSSSFDGFLDESPIMPLCYRYKCLIISRKCSANASPYQYNIYSGLFD